MFRVLFQFRWVDDSCAGLIGSSMFVQIARRFGLFLMMLALTSPSASSRESGSSMLVFSVAMSPDVSFREEQINQTILKSVVLQASRLPDVAPCELHRPFQIV